MVLSRWPRVDRDREPLIGLGEDGALVVEMPLVLSTNEYFEAEVSARAEYPPGPFDSKTDFWIVASRDGVGWTTWDLDDGDGAVSIGAYPVANADRILLSVEGEWQVLDFG